MEDTTVMEEGIRMLQSVSCGQVVWRFVLRERRDGKSSLLLDVVERETVRGREITRASLVVLSSGDLTRRS